MVLFVFQFYSVGNFGKLISFGHGTVSSERVNSADTAADLNGVSKK